MLTRMYAVVVLHVAVILILCGCTDVLIEQYQRALWSWACSFASMWFGLWLWDAGSRRSKGGGN